MAETLKVLVTGATGKQGGAVARLLRQRRHRVRALTRRPDSEAARELTELGVIIAEGNMDDPASLRAALSGVDAVFAMATPYERGVEAEIREGKNLADAASEADVGHFVYSSVGSVDRKTGIPHFESKQEIEEHIRDLGLPYTMVRPVYFMENLFYPASLQALKSGILSMPLQPGRKLQQIDIASVAQFAVMALEEPDSFLGQSIDIASDELDGDQAAAALTRTTGRTIRFVPQPIADVRAASQDLAAMYEWFDRVGYDVDIAALRADYPSVHWRTFETWAGAIDWGSLLQPGADTSPTP